MPGLAGPNMLGTIAFRNLMQVGYGLNVLIAGGGSVQFLLGDDAAKVWALVVVACSITALAGCYLTAKTGDTRLELWSSIGVLATYAGQMVAVILCVLYAIGPNGLLPFWWPAAIAAQTLWRIRNIVRSERAKDAAARRRA
jgi:hypothetical protein